MSADVLRFPAKLRAAVHTPIEAAHAALDRVFAGCDRLEAMNARCVMRSAVQDGQITLGVVAHRLEWLGSSLPEGSPGHDLCVETIRLLKSAHGRIAEMDRQAREIEDRLEGPKTGGAA